MYVAGLIFRADAITLPATSVPSVSRRRISSSSGWSSVPMHTTRSRGTMRAERQRAAIPTVALAGYTNAGKSTLLNAVTGAGVSVGDRLFHTLDPTTRSFEHGGRKYLLTDTVGFIRKLPHQLVDAFKATLEETTLADLIVHVVDGSEPPASRDAAMRAVDSVLEEIGAGNTPRVVAFNKIDLLDEDARRDLLVGRRGAVGVSATTGEGVGALLDAIEDAFAKTLERVELLIPYGEGATLNELHEIAGQVDREDREDGVLVKARVPRSLTHRFSAWSVNGRAA
jgi:GTP-binding protein HflX